MAASEKAQAKKKLRAGFEGRLLAEKAELGRRASPQTAGESGTKELP